MMPINLAIVGTGMMAGDHATFFSKIPGCICIGVFDVDASKARKFAADHGIPRVYDSLEDCLGDKNVTAIANVTPDRFHAGISIAAAKAGKHIFCEKPLAESEKDAQAMADAASEYKVINMVNFSYRNAAALHKAREMVSSGLLGRIMHVEASYMQSWLCANYWGAWTDNPALLWRMSTAHGSKGVLGDIGVHILDFVSYPMDSLVNLHCKMKTFEKSTGKQFGNYHLDANDSAVISMEFASGALGSINISRWATGRKNRINMCIYGDEGSIEIDLDKSYDKLLYCSKIDKNKCEFKTLDCGKVPNLFERFISSIQENANQQPDFKRGVYVQKLLDTCFISHHKGTEVSLQ